MKMLMTLLLLPLFVAVQSTAAICSFQCDLDKLPGSASEEATSEHQGCHQDADESDVPLSDNKSGCASKVCQLDEIIKSEIVKLNDNFQGEFLIFPTITHSFTYQTTGQFSVMFSTGPPGIKSFFNIPLYISKSSYII